MKKIVHTISYLEFDSIEELSPTDRELLKLAGQAAITSHAPYSHYHVGAAVRLANGKVFTGSNQENMAFPSGLCAERVAVFYAAATCPDIPMETLAITARADFFEVCDPVPPCGMCRQAIIEYEFKFNRKIRLILSGEKGKIFLIEGMDTLLPLTFHEKGLIK
ncbi:MAG: cytidine deaminase [Bacteroidales bacterium]|nr:cytidine deaminase [Bacteroidales bacterium]MDD4602234.1 cytidine deaminase [Bacteroidales bacterium]